MIRSVWQNDLATIKCNLSNRAAASHEAGEGGKVQTAYRLAV